ncbi:MAG: glyceraldehyde 3-phosphate dehydrogenase NAD-binding domain-containing protein [Gammaproteobacteria bacterium]
MPDSDPWLIATNLGHQADRLYRVHRIRLTLFGQPVHNRSTSALLRGLKTAQDMDGRCIPERLDSILQAVLNESQVIERGGIHLDLGDLCAESLRADSGINSEQLRASLSALKVHDRPRDVIVHGFGRIGRLLVRQMYEAGMEPELQLKGICVRKGTDLNQRANLLQHDSVHGQFSGTVQAVPEGQQLIINGQHIPVYYSLDDPRILELEGALLLESTGIGRDLQSLQAFIRAPQITQVVLTAPGKGGVPNLVHGISDLSEHASSSVLAAASCTTNAVVPILDVLNRQAGLRQAHIETIHAMTNDQNLVDNAHSSPRRGRSATSNMVMTSTGAAKAVTEILPNLAGRLSANAIRVPVANVSLLACNLDLDAGTDTDTVRRILHQASRTPTYRDLIGYSDNPEQVSSDLIGDRHACTIDGASISAQDGRARLYAWYDNEAGYALQVLRLAAQLSPCQIP